MVEFLHDADAIPEEVPAHHWCVVAARLAERIKELEEAREALEWLHAAHMDHALTGEDAWETLRRGLIAPRERLERVGGG